MESFRVITVLERDKNAFTNRSQHVEARSQVSFSVSIETPIRYVVGEPPFILTPPPRQSTRIKENS